MPSRRQEAWRFSNLKLLFGDSNLEVASPASASSVTREDIEEHLVEACSGAQLVFVDGLFSELLSDTSKLDDLGGQPPSKAFAGPLSRLAAQGESQLLERSLKELDFLPEISYDVDHRTCSGSAPLSALNQVRRRCCSCIVSATPTTRPLLCDSQVFFLFFPLSPRLAWVKLPWCPSVLAPNSPTCSYFSSPTEQLRPSTIPAA